MRSTAGVGAVAYLMRADVRTGASTFRRNLKVIRGWLEEQGSAAQQCAASKLCSFSGVHLSLLA